MEIALSMTKSSMDFHDIPIMVVSSTGLTEQVTHYYPYGGVIGGIDKAPTLQPYKFGENELERTYGLDWYDIHARQYDPVVPSWNKIDPLCENYYNTSPYAYCAGNPVNAVDPDGMDWYRSNSTLYYTWFNGNNSIEGYTYIGEKGSVLGEFETIIDNILCGEEGLGIESLYSEGFTFDIAPSDKGALIGSRERGWDFLDEFLCDAGPEFSVLLGNHPYINTLKNEDRVKESQQIIRARGNDGKRTNVGREFKPWDIFSYSPWSPMQLSVLIDTMGIAVKMGIISITSLLTQRADHHFFIILE